MEFCDEFVSCSLKLYRSLTSGKGLRSIVDTAAEIIKNPVVVADSSYKVLAYSEVQPCSDQMWRDIVKTGFYPTDYIDYIAYNGMSRDMAYGSGVPNVFSDGMSGRKYLCKPITINGKPSAFASCIEYSSPFTEFEARLFEIFCEVVGTELGSSELTELSYNRRQDYFISEMISGKVRADFWEERLRQVVLQLKNCNFVLVAVFANEGIRRDHQLAFHSKALEQIIPGSHCITYRNSCVTLISRDDSELMGDALSESLHKHLEAAGMLCGVSRCFEHIADMAVYYAQAVDAIRLGRKLRPGDVIFDYVRMSVFHMIDIAGQSEDLRAFCDPKFLDILEYDNKFNTKYFKTANEYLRCNRSPGITAERLNIHRNSVDYRIRKIEALFGFSFENIETAFSLQLSCRILEYLGDL